MKKLSLTEVTCLALEGRLQEGVINNVEDIKNIMSKYPEFIYDSVYSFTIYYRYRNIQIRFNLEYDICETELGLYIDDIAIKNGYRANLQYKLAKIPDFVEQLKQIFTNTIDEVDEFLDLQKYDILNKNFEKYILNLKNNLDSFIDNNALNIIKQYGTKLKPAITEKQFIKIAKEVQKIIQDKYNIQITTDTFKPQDEDYDEGWALKCTFNGKENILGIIGDDQGNICLFSNPDAYNPQCHFRDNKPNYLEDIKNSLISYIDEFIEKEKQDELNKTRLKYNIVYYLNTATRERREETREDVENDYCNTIEYFDTDLEAFEYIMTDILELNPRDYYNNEQESDDEKIKDIIDYFRGQDYGDGEVIICKVVGKKYKYSNGLTKKSFFDMVSGNY